MDQHIVVVGAGLAGAGTVESLRNEGFNGRLTLVGDELELPYERPPLSKGYLMGKDERNQLFVHDEAWYDQQDVDLRLGQAVIGIERSDRRLIFGGAVSLRYSRLLLATGARPRPLPIPGADAAGVYQLRTLDDADRLSVQLASAERLIVIGAGWIGLEVTAAARAAGVAVTVLEYATLPLLRVLGPEVARVFADLHLEHGVDLRFGVTVESVMEQAGRAAGVWLSDGSLVEADAIVVAVGAVPNAELATGCGLAVDDGVVVDAGFRTKDPLVFAVGDVAKADHPFYGRALRVEHWDNAKRQPAVAAASMLGRPARYTELPYFYTDQYDLGMEYVGHVGPDGYDRVVFRGDVDRREFIAFWLRNERVIAAMNVNVWDVNDALRSLIAGRRPVDPDRLTDPDGALV